MDMHRHKTVATTGRRHHHPHLISFQEHRQRLKRATGQVEQRSPRLPAMQMGGLASVSQDARRFLERTNENAHLVLNLSRIMRTGGTTIATSDDRLPKNCSLLLMRRRVEELQRQNDCLGRRLRVILARRSDVFSRYSDCALELPADKGQLLRLLRPRIVLYFGLMDGRSLGRVVVQLYTEAAPLVVLQFIRSCRRQRAHEFAVRRVFPNLWLEGYLLGGCHRPADPPPDLGEPMEFDTRVLSHGRHNCVLSCAKEYCVHGFPGGAINFSISFKPLTAANGQRVGFGRVVRGDNVIGCMQLYGTKNGKMIRPLVITHCDVL